MCLYFSDVWCCEPAISPWIEIHAQSLNSVQTVCECSKIGCHSVQQCVLASNSLEVGAVGHVYMIDPDCDFLAFLLQASVVILMADINSGCRKPEQWKWTNYQSLDQMCLHHITLKKSKARCWQISFLFGLSSLIDVVSVCISSVKRPRLLHADAVSFWTFFKSLRG